MLVKVTRLNYDASPYTYAPTREEAVVNTASVQSVTASQARGEGPFCLLTFQDGTQMTVIGTPEGLLNEWYEAEHVRGVELAKVRDEAVGPSLLLQSEPMTYQSIPTNVAEAVVAEREECAQLADKEAYYCKPGESESYRTARCIAELIRARGADRCV